MEALHIILSVAIGALIGYCTNYIAIKMLFLPRRELKVGKWTVPFTPGVIPKNKSRMAVAVGNAVGERLLTEQDIVENLKISGINEKAVNGIVNFVMEDTTSLNNIIIGLNAEANIAEITNDISCMLGEKIISGIKKLDMKTIISNIGKEGFSDLLSNPMIAMFAGGSMLDFISDKMGNAVIAYIDAEGENIVLPLVKQEVEAVFSQSLKYNFESINMDKDTLYKLISNIVDGIIEGNISDLIKCLNVKDIVEEKINAMDVKELEEMVLSVMKNELQAVVNLGAFIGAFIGIINIFI